MHKSALNLFLNECTALSLQDIDETQGGLTSALQKRHKIRETDITKVFEKADAEGDREFSRAYLVILLVLLSGAAYDSISGLVKAKKNALGKVLVKPHWDPGMKYPLSSIYTHEPMNLFPGWSSTNLRNNKSMLDTHWLTVDGTMISSDLHGEIRSGSTSSGENVRITEHLFPEEAQSLKHREGGGNLPGKNRRMSDYSFSIDGKAGTWQRRLNNLDGPHTVQYDQQRALKKFEHLRLELQQTTKSGQDHYTLLLTALQARGFSPGDAVFDSINSAKMSWTLHRNLLDIEIGKYIDEIRKDFVNEPDIMKLTHALKKN